jgi:soluble lytic murein transglycosylase-like protein
LGKRTDDYRIPAVQRESDESLVDLDVRAARSLRAAAARRASRARPKRARKLRRPTLALLLAFGGGLAIVSGSIGVPELTGHGHATIRQAVRCPVPASLRPAFVAAAHKTGLPLSLLVALGQVESRLNQKAQSSAGAVGVLQLMPSTAASLGADPSQAKQNVLAGARYLKLLLKRYGTNYSALAAYNAGPTAVDDSGGTAPSVETLSYVENVEYAWKTLAGCN